MNDLGPEQTITVPEAAAAAGPDSTERRLADEQDDHVMVLPGKDTRKVTVGRFAVVAGIIVSLIFGLSTLAAGCGNVIAKNSRRYLLRRYLG